LETTVFILRLAERRQLALHWPTHHSAKNPRLGLILAFLVIIAVLGSGLAAAAPASANEASPPIDEVGPAPEPPEPGYDDGKLCNPFGIGVYETDLRTPERVEEGVGPTASGPLRGNGIWSEGSVVVNANTSCSHAQIKFQLESNFCNRVGRNCNWKPISEGGWQLLPISGSLSEEHLGECRSGTDSYRMAAIVSHVEMSFEETPLGGFVPYLETKTAEFYSDEIKLDCR
jgi:hypothetical protein